MLAVQAVALLAPSSIGRAATQTIRIVGDGLDPASTTVTPGTIVTWVNLEGNRHRIRSQTGPVEFDSGDLDPGESFSVTFDVLGTYGYVDDRNREDTRYHGTVVVRAAPTPAPSVGASPTPPPAALEVRMAGRVFRPATLTTDAGKTVTFINDDGRDHTVTARDGSYDSGVMNPGAQYQRTYPTAGTYAYFCAIHPDMTGTVVVRSPGGGTPPPPSPTPIPTPTPSLAPPPPGGVTIVDFDYVPTTINASAGATITWVNRGVALHTVTARDGGFDSGFISVAGTFSRRFPTPGTYLYLCSLHPTMTGTIAISGPDGAPPPPPRPQPSSTPGPSAPAGAIAVVDFAFRPATLTIPVGTRLTWINTGAAPHTVTSRAGLFDSGILSAGARFSRLFATPGTYPFFCSLHPGMTGTVFVPGSDGVAPPPASPPPPPPVTGPSDLRIVDFGYSPSSITVPLGTTLRWVNAGVAPHTVTDRAGRFDSGFLSTGDIFSRRFDALGSFEYFCAIHPEMTGTVIVGEGGSAPAPAPSASAGGGPAPGSPQVVMLDFLFEPPTITVPASSKVTFVNEGAALHTATAVDGAWDTGVLDPGGAASIDTPPPGTWNYVCTFHPQMLGTLIVVDAASGASPPPPGGPATPPTGDGPAPVVPSGASSGVEDLVYWVAALLIMVVAVALFAAVIHGVAVQAERDPDVTGS